MEQKRAMNYLEFQKKFSTEELCRAHLYKMRWPTGFTCPKCGVKGEPFHIASRKRYQCKSCNHQASVTSGTIMDKTRVPLMKWFSAMFLISHDKQGCTVARMGRQLDLPYATAWLLCHKICSEMGMRYTQYILSGYVERDEACFSRADESQSADSSRLLGQLGYKGGKG